MMLPTEKDFRDCGMTINALQYPMSDAAVDWLAQYNGVRAEQLPKAARYAPNKAMLEYCERKGSGV